MANSIEAALNRASVKEKQIIETGKSLISENADKAVSQHTNSNASAVENALNRASAQDKQIIEAGKAHIISAENTNQISPSNAPSQTQANSKALEQKTLDPQTQTNIESIQRGGGNNYLYPNAVDRAQSRPSQERQKSEPEQEKEH